MDLPQHVKLDTISSATQGRFLQLKLTRLHLVLKPKGIRPRLFISCNRVGLLAQLFVFSEEVLFYEDEKSQKIVGNM